MCTRSFTQQCGLEPSAMVFDYHFIFLSVFFIFTLPLSDFETICKSVRAHILYMPRFPQSWFGSFKWNVYMKFRNFHWNFNCLIKYLNTFCSALLPHLILLCFFLKLHCSVLPLQCIFNLFNSKPVYGFLS